MKWRSLCIIALLLAPMVLAETVVEERNSGITRGSVEFLFTYDPADPDPVEIIDIRQNDLTSIHFRGEKIELFWKSRIGDSWGYEVIHGKRGLSISLGERTPIDVDADGEDDLLLEFTAWEDRKGLLTFHNARISEEAIVIEQPMPETPPPPVQPPVPDDGTVQDDLGLVPEEPEEVEIDLPAPDAPVEPIEPASSGSGMLVFFILVIVVICGIIIYNAVKTPSEKPKRKGKKPKKAETKPEAEKPAEKPAEKQG